MTQPRGDRGGEVMLWIQEVPNLAGHLAVRLSGLPGHLRVRAHPFRHRLRAARPLRPRDRYMAVRLVMAFRPSSGLASTSR